MSAAVSITVLHLSLCLPQTTPFPCTSVLSSPRKSSLLLLINQKPLYSSRLISTNGLSPGTFLDHPDAQPSLPSPRLFHPVLSTRALSSLQTEKAEDTGPQSHLSARATILCSPDFRHRELLMREAAY